VGTFNVSVTVTNTSQLSASATVTVNISSKEVTISKGKFQLNFKTRKDSLDVYFSSADFLYQNKNAFLAATNNQPVQILIGTTPFDDMTLNKGKGKGVGTLTWNYKKGELHYTARNVALQDIMNSYGAGNIDASGNDVKVPLKINISGVLYGGEYTFKYSATANKTGKAQVPKQ
jgi:hypothetical protein